MTTTRKKKLRRSKLLSLFFALIACICLGILFYQFRGIRELKSELAHRKMVIDKLSAEVAGFAGQYENVSQMLRSSRAGLDSLRTELMQAEKDVSRIGKQLDTLANRHSYTTVEKKHLVERLRECHNKDAQIDLLQKEIARQNRRIKQAQLPHEIKVLFVLDNYFSSSFSDIDETIDKSQARRDVIRQFDSCSSLLGWNIQYCDIPGKIYAVNSGNSYESIRKSSQKFELTAESLYLLSKAARYFPYDVKKDELKHIVVKSFRDYQHEQERARLPLASSVSSDRFKDYLILMEGILPDASW
ncbi:MAG: hypothetical protein GF398_05235 [Chitinivibrionales bacterium]|nr:hypothetical protein [Chitinivibrionales bacterium]